MVVTITQNAQAILHEKNKNKYTIKKRHTHTHKPTFTTILPISASNFRVALLLLWGFLDPAIKAVHWQFGWQCYRLFQPAQDQKPLQLQEGVGLLKWNSHHSLDVVEDKEEGKTPHVKIEGSTWS